MTLKVCTAADIRILRCEYEMWRVLSKGAVCTSWPRGAGLSRKKGYTSTIFSFNHGHLDHAMACVCCLWNILLHSTKNPGCINSGLYLLYNGYEGMTSLVRRAQRPVGVAVVDESRRLRTPGQRQVAFLLASL